MTTIINHDLRVVDGGTVYMPPYIGGEAGWGNLDIPSVYVASAVQHYPRGTMFRKGDKSWVYTKLKTTTNANVYGGYTGGLGLFSVAQDSSNLGGVSATIGEYTVTTTDTLTVNAFAGGLLTMFEADQPIVSMGIVSNTATVITLDGALPGTYTSSATCQVIASPYYEVVMVGASCNADGVYDYCPGIFNSPLDGDGNDTAVSDFVWLQCWGLCFTWASGTYEGETGGERTAVMMGDGACQIMAQDDYRHNRQVVGYLFPGTGDVTVGNNPATDDGTDVDFMNHIIYLTIRQ